MRRYVQNKYIIVYNLPGYDTCAILDPGLMRGEDEEGNPITLGYRHPDEEAALTKSVNGKQVRVNVPEGVSYLVTTRDKLPTLGQYRSAFRFDGRKVTTDLETAKDLQRDLWREARTPLLKDLDTEYQQALESKDEDAQDRIVVKKQQLRDVTLEDLSMIKTPEQLKDVWPEVLNA